MTGDPLSPGLSTTMLMDSHDNDRFHQVVYVHYGYPQIQI